MNILEINTHISRREIEFVTAIYICHRSLLCARNHYSGPIRTSPYWSVTTPLILFWAKRLALSNKAKIAIMKREYFISIRF